MNKKLEQIKNELNDEYHTYIGSDKFNNQIMMNSFLLDKLAAFELRLRNLEAGKNRSDFYLNLHTPLI